MADKNNIYFAGGKLIRLEASKPGDNGEGIKLERDDTTRNWTLTIKTVISKAAAENVILKHSDLGLTGTQIPASNMPNIAGLDDNNKSILIKILDNSTIVPTFYEQNGSFTIKLNLNMAKTQNSKTQNAVGGGH